MDESGWFCPLAVYAHGLMDEVQVLMDQKDEHLAVAGAAEDDYEFSIHLRQKREDERATAFGRYQQILGQMLHWKNQSMRIRRRATKLSKRIPHRQRRKMRKWMLELDDGLNKTIKDKNGFKGYWKEQVVALAKEVKKIDRETRQHWKRMVSHRAEADFYEQRIQDLYREYADSVTIDPLVLFHHW